MHQKIFLVKKDPVASKSEIEWIQMSGSEFYSFIKSAEAKGRYFICLTDDVSYECPEIYIETSYADYKKWKAEYNAHQYLKEQEKPYETFSADTSVTEDSCLLDTIADDDFSPEEIAVMASEKNRLMSAINSLPKAEQYIVYRLYFDKPPQKQQRLADELGIKKDVLTKRKQKILKKIAALLGNF
jgi:hypothetical protein